MLAMPNTARVRPVSAFACGGLLGAALVLLILLLADSGIARTYGAVALLCVLLLGLGIGFADGVGFAAGRRRISRRGARIGRTRILTNMTILLVMLALCFLFGAILGAFSGLSITSMLAEPLGIIGAVAVFALTSFALGVINGMAPKPHIVLSALLGGVFGPLGGAVFGIGLGITYYATYTPAPCQGSCSDLSPVGGTIIVVIVTTALGLAIGIILCATPVIGLLLSRPSHSN